MRSFAGIIGFIIFVALVLLIVGMRGGSKVGNALDPCQRAAAQGVTYPGCK